MKNKEKKLRAMILGGYVNGLGIVRSLAKNKVKSLVLDIKPSIAGASKWSEQMICPDPVSETEEFIKFIKRIGLREGSPFVVFTTNDIWMYPILQYKKELNDILIYPMSDWNIIKKCLDKEKLIEMAVRHGIPCPKSIFPKNTNELRSANKSLLYPAILKPVETVGFMEALMWQGRSVIIENEKQLYDVADELDKAKLSKRSIILQEYIPGDVENLYTYTSYSDKNADVKAWSTGYKIRQYPPMAGTITAGKVLPVPELAEIGKKFIKSIEFYGIANTEFKKDAITGEFKLIEINARPGMWNRSAFETGVNLPAIAYEEAVGNKTIYCESSDKELIWVHFIMDAYYAILANNKKGYHNYSWNIYKWLKSIKGKKIDAVFDINDPLPFIYLLWFLIRDIKKLLIRH